MAILVQKYGGSSVADMEKLQRVADKVVAAKRAGNSVVVTVSAMGKSTDNLLKMAREAACVAGENINPPRRELDMLLSTGERVSMSLLCIALAARGEQAISFTGSQSGIITNDRHFDARIIEVRPHRIEDELERGRIVVVAGYQGMSYKREITTLGRGGTDTTAVALAAALGAERCEIYSDVDGVYSADPRVVPDAQHLPEIAPNTLQEMAECGAKVLNAQAVAWAKKAGVRVYARSSFDAWDKHSGFRQTVIANDCQSHARSVVGEENVAFCRLEGAEHSMFERLTSWAAEAEVPIKELAMHGSRGSFLIPLLNVPDWEQKKVDLRAVAGTALELLEGYSGVSLVGDGLAAQGTSLPDFMRIVRDCGGNLGWVQSGALRYSALIERDRLGATQRALHDAFVPTA
jgi:aspartate kinase